MVSWVNIWLAGILKGLISSPSTGEKTFFKTCSTSFFLNPFLLIQSHSEKSRVCFSHVRVTLGTKTFICSNYNSFSFRMCVGSKILISHSHKQMMTRQLPRAVSRRENKTEHECNTQQLRPPAGSSPQESTVRCAAVPGGGHLLVGED